MERRSLGCWTWVLALAWLLAARADAVPVTLVADTHVNAARPAVNSGGISNINVGGGYTGLLQFDLSALPAGTTSAQISRAVLRLYVNQVSTPGTLSVAPMVAPWSESGVTYQTMPALGVTAGTFPINQAGAYIAVDVTALVRGWLAAPASNEGLALTGMTAVAQFDSKENDLTGHAPALDVDLVGQAGPAGAPGSAGLAGAQGVAGPAGAAGAVGLQGIAGPQGNAGPQGVSGPIGAIGATGTTGPAGTAGVQGSAGPSGSIGPTGATGAAGAIGPVGAMGPAGSPGVAGPAGPPVSFRGPWSAGSTYAVGDAVSFAGSSYAALGANTGQQPDQSPGTWSVLAQAGAPGVAGAQGPAGLTGATGQAGSQGIAGPAGATGAPGPSGTAGPTGAAGVQGVAGAPGATGSAGAPGLTFRGAWSSGYGYVANDAVTYGGATWLAQAASHSIAPGSDPTSWSVLAAAGGAGPTGPSGTAATVVVGTVTTGAAGTSASVVNTGSSATAVLNFTIPQGANGAPGTGSGTGATSGIPFASMYHAVSYAATFYALNNTNQSSTETAQVLAWVPNGCSASKLVVYSQQAATITVTLRYGTPGSMVNSVLTCQAATRQSCTATGAESIPAGSFADLEIDHADSNPVGVWTAVICN